ncbi:MAG: DNA polymerase III subunit delta' [Firmicutes bacterium]|nr:DNA polymerase III subunit delta' [Bacillota bacterium]
MALNRVCGQAVARSLLNGIVRSGKVAHAYLFCGPDGTGKSLAAREFVKAVNCEKGESPGDACDTCSSCARIESGNHPDLIVIETDGQSIKIDQARAALKHIAYRPLEARSKAVIIKRADLMTAEAANCLLKGLEEPPGYCVFVLTAPGAASVLPTVASRCQVVPFSACTVEEVRSYLEYRHPGEESRCRAAAFWSGGVPGKGDLFFDEGFLKVRDAARAALENMKTLDVIGFAGEIGKDGAPLFLECLESLMRDMLVLGCGAPESLLANPDLREDLGRTLETWTPGGTARAFDQVTRTRAAVEANAARRLALEVMLLKLQADVLGGYN